jgi:uncharacterized membrane protein YgcG
LIAKIEILNSVQKALDSLLTFVPKLIGFLIILLIGYIVARIIKTIITKALEKAGLDKALHSGQSGQYVEKLSPGASPSKLIGSIAYWVVFLGVLSIAIGVLKIALLTTLVASIGAYLPHVIVAILIFVIAGVISGAVGGAVAKTMGDTPTGKVIGTAVPALVMGIAVFMILTELKIAPEIVKITYTALIGAVALGSALAFGLGGREVAGKLVCDAYGKGQEKKEDVKDDLQKGKERGQEHAEQAKDKAQEQAGEGGSGSGGSSGPSSGGSSSGPGSYRPGQ